MGLFDFLDKRKKDNKLDTMAHSNDLSMTEMTEVQKSMQENMSEESYNSKFNIACRTMTSGEYQKAIEEFEEVHSNSTTEMKGTCENQIGACYYFQNEFEKAISYYVKSIENGFYPDVADDNIWESCEALIKNGDSKWAHYYLEVSAEGKYIKEANKYIK
jgi:tetratricopeptide (TPR) repeat protein